MAASVEEELQQFAASIGASVNAVEARVKAVEVAQADARSKWDAHMASQLEETPYVPLGLVQSFAGVLNEQSLREAALAAGVPTPAPAPAPETPTT